MFNSFSLITAIFLIIFPVSASYGNSIKDAWELFLNNKPQKAADIFADLTSSNNLSEAAQAYRGLSSVDIFLNHPAKSVTSSIEAFRKDKDLTRLSARPNFIKISRDGSSQDSKIMKTIQDAALNGGLFSGWYQDAMLQHYLNCGNTRKAASIRKKMGIVSSWKFIGPFENISDCGFSNSYSPEKEINFSKEYTGKNGNKVKWHELFPIIPTGWIFLENYTTDYNAVYYFYSNIKSEQQKDALLAFGASGTFKIFLNGNPVLQDSVFRNTGIDAYIQKVKLLKGDNELLVKIGHETGNPDLSLSGKANFLLRFLDSSYKPLSGVNYSTSEANYTKDSSFYADLTPSPVLDSIASVLNGAISKDSSDFDALFALISLYNIYEKTNEAQLIIQNYLEKYPQSSLLHSLLGESLMRARKKTDYEITMKKAYDLCNLNADAWNKQLSNCMSKENARSVLEFLENSPAQFQRTSAAAVAYLSTAIMQKNKHEIFNRISQIEQHHIDDGEAVNLLASIYVSQGLLKKAAVVLENYLSTHRTLGTTYTFLADLALKQGNVSKGINIYKNAIKADPSDPNSYYYLSNIFYSKKMYNEALSYINRCLSIIPNSANVLNLKANIFASMGANERAINTFMETVNYTDDDFVAWESIRALNGRKSYESMTPLPGIDSLVKASSQWLKRNPDKSALLSYIEDVYLYPSRSSRSRIFMAIYLPNQKEIDTWKEYRIPYNPNYQRLSIDRAYSRKRSGSEVQADHEQNYIVFKSLEPGDCIVLEYSLKDYFEGSMAGKVYGRQDFEMGLPSFDSRLRLITPENDTIPYKIFGDSIKVSTSIVQDYRITTLSSNPYTTESLEPFCPADHPSYSKVTFSNFDNWRQISEWYYELSRHKQKQTLELENIADSLFSGVVSKWEKAKRVHEFITRNINYSFVPFRQSAWIPQSAQTVLATKIGDCKDMASLGKCLMDIAGIQSSLVLVNTGIRHFTDHAYIGPNFDHCILQFTIDSTEQFVDFTDNNTALGDLPLSDQGAMALVIKPGNNTITLLPLDTPDQRQISRNIEMVLDSSGSLVESVDCTADRNICISHENDLPV